MGDSWGYENPYRGDSSTATVDIYQPLVIPGDCPTVLYRRGGPVESNERYYRRRAVEERMAAQRAVTETARAWHAKLAEDFAARAAISTADICTSSCTQAAVNA